MALPIRIQARSGRQIPLSFEVIYTAFVCVLVLYYWVTYTPWNFLYIPTHAGLRKLFAEPATTSVTMVEEVV